MDSTKPKRITTGDLGDALSPAMPRLASSGIAPRRVVIAMALAILIGIGIGIGLHSTIHKISILFGSPDAFLAPKKSLDESKVNRLLNLSSQIWPIFDMNSSQGIAELTLQHGKLPVSQNNPLVMNLSTFGMADRLHDIRAKIMSTGIINLPKIMLENEALDILEAVSQVGLNGVALQCIEGGQTQPQHCHRVAAVLMDVAMSRTSNLTHYLEATGPSEEFPYPSPSDQLWHGGIMHWAAVTAHLPGNLWKHFLAQIEPFRSTPMNSVMVWNLWHATGHGAVIRAALRKNQSLRAEYTPHHPFWDGSAPTVSEAVFLEADATCSRAPNELAAFQCANGIMHHLVMHMPIANEFVQNWAYPCDKARSFWTAAGCFYFSTLIRPNAKADSWRFRKVLRQPKKWSELCLQFHSEHVVRGCIFGLSANMFPIFEHSVAEVTLQAAGEVRQLRSGAIISRKKMCDEHFHDALCAMESREQARPAPAGQSLTQWCTRFLSGSNDDEDVLRFYTCVDGSQWSNGEWGGWWNMRGPRIFSGPPTNQFWIDLDDKLHSYCDQVLITEWHADANIRSKASELCYRRIQSLRQEAVPWPSLDMPSKELGLSFETEAQHGEAPEEPALTPNIKYLEPDGVQGKRIEVAEMEAESTSWQSDLVKDFGAK